MTEETVGEAGRAGIAAVRRAARVRGRSLVRRGGARLARLSRGRIGHWLILRVIPLAIRRRFDPGSAADLEATFELRLHGPGSPVSFALVIGGGGCAVRRGPVSDPAAVAALAADDLILLASGAASWPELLSSGRFELSGDPFVALRFASVFRLPVSAY